MLGAVLVPRHLHLDLNLRIVISHNAAVVLQSAAVIL